MNLLQRPIILITFHQGHVAVIQALQALDKYRVVVFGGEEFLHHVSLCLEVAEAEAKRRIPEWIQAVRQRCDRRPYHVYGHDVTREVSSILESLVLHHFPNTSVVPAESEERPQENRPRGAS